MAGVRLKRNAMKSVIIQSLVTAIMAAIVTLFINYFTGMRLDKDGFIKTDGLYRIDNSFYKVVEIGNYTDKYIEYVDISTTGKDTNYSIDILDPIVFNKISESKNESIFRVNSLPPRRTTRILFSEGDNLDINYISASTENLEILSQKTPVSKRKQVLNNAFINSIVYGVIFFIFAFSVDSRKHKLIKEVKEELAYARNELVDLRRSTEKNKEHMAKYKTLLLKRITDLSKELSFWRGTFATIAKNKSNYGELKDQIVKSLKTFTNEKNSLPGLDEIKVIENVYLNNKEESLTKK